LLRQHNATTIPHIDLLLHWQFDFFSRVFSIVKCDISIATNRGSKQRPKLLKGMAFKKLNEFLTRRWSQLYI